MIAMTGTESILAAMVLALAWIGLIAFGLFCRECWQDVQDRARRRRVAKEVAK